MISLIVAVAENGVIGDRNALLWHISEDLRHFKAVTTGHPVVMGRKTWESLAELNEIFKVSGGSEMFDTIERHSDRKAREMGYEEGADQQYMMDVFLSNSNEHY